jgi:preprotein translocase SecE subunit
MATDVIVSGADEGGDRPQKPLPPPQTVGAPPSGGFFHIYKRGQGYWTRMGTAAGAAMVIVLTALFFFSQLPPFLQPTFQRTMGPGVPDAERAAEVTRSMGVAKNVGMGLAIATIVLGGLGCWWAMNKPRNADFLIATDSEMKKVNWTSRKELFGSTKVVILFMFLIAFLLFAIDVLFGYFFYFINVLKSRPF